MTTDWKQDRLLPVRQSKTRTALLGILLTGMLTLTLCACHGRYEPDRKEQNQLEQQWQQGQQEQQEQGPQGQHERQAQQNANGTDALQGMNGTAKGTQAGAKSEAANGEPDAQKTETGTIGLQLCGEPKTLDPAKNNSTRVLTLMVQTRENLLTYDEAGTLIPGQAESYECSEDGLTYTFHLRDNLKWSDGTALTADDFVYTWQRAADAATDCTWSEELLSGVRGFQEARAGDRTKLEVSSPNGKTFVVKLLKPNEFFLQVCAFPALSPVEKSVVEENPETWSDNRKTWTGNGPMVVRQWIHGIRMELVKNEYYRAADEIKTEKLVLYLTEDRQTAYELFTAGTVQFAADFPRYLLEQPDSLPGLVQMPVRKTEYVMLQNQTEPLNLKLVRQALALAADNEQIRQIIRSAGNLPADRLIGPGYSDGEDGTAFYRQDLEEKQQNQSEESQPLSEEQQRLKLAAYLLERAGYPEGKGVPELAFVTNASAYDTALAEALSDAWARLGIQTRVKPLNWFEFVPVRESGAYDLTRYSFVSDLDSPLGQLSLFQSVNTAGYRNPKVNRLIREAPALLDRRAGYEKYHEAEELILKDYALIPLSFCQDNWLQSETLTGVFHNAAGWWDFSKAGKSSGSADRK